jgi:hypothetical protein
MIRRLVAIAMLSLVACKPDSPPPPPPLAAVPTRGAAGDTDVRVMVTELAAAKACVMLRGSFHGLRAPDAPDVVVGVLWLRQCEITSAGVHLTVHVVGTGWVWVDQSKNKDGGTFAVRQYVRFRVETTMAGVVDVAYAREPHVATLWFTPDRAPEIVFATIGDVDVDREGAWSSVLGVLGSALGSSPEAAASKEATTQGTRAISVQLANGFAVTTDLCTGLTRAHLGRPQKGKMGADDVGETERIPVEIHPGGVMMLGPQHAGHGMTLDAEPLQGAVRLRLMCADQAALAAADVMEARPIRSFQVLATFDVRKRLHLAFAPAACPVVVVVTSLDDAPARFAWRRPSAEIARSTGGPMIACTAPPPTK